MRITIDTHEATPAEMGILIATLVACGAAVPDVARGVAMQEVRIDVPSSDAFDSFDKRAGSLLGLAGIADTDEIIKLVGLLNDELYRRCIPAADNPETGADVKQTGETSLNSTPADTDLSKIFGSGKTETVDLRVDKQTADAVNANPQGAAEALAKGAEQMLGVVLDKAGVPWDSRIHSASKTINQTDGLWRQKRGVSPDLVATVVAQLKQAQSVARYGDTHGSAELDADAAKLTAMGGDAGPTKQDVFGTNQHQGRVVGVSRAANIPPPPKATGLPAPDGVNAVTHATTPADTGQIDSLPKLLKFITEQKLAGKIAQVHVTNALLTLGIEGPLPVLAGRPDLIPEMVKKLKLIGGIE